jgi:hypothetical protein
MVSVNGVAAIFQSFQGLKSKIDLRRKQRMRFGL